MTCQHCGALRGYNVFGEPAQWFECGTSLDGTEVEEKCHTRRLAIRAVAAEAKVVKLQKANMKLRRAIREIYGNWQATHIYGS